ncbi:MAG: 16S rRNA (adenine(1518)-N(6)/adenine(1519)-N(6))-dimethyltransferase RsmA [Desulfurococcaceae archaeon]
MEKFSKPLEFDREFLLKWTIGVMRKHGIKPRKKLSQNFIVNPFLIEEILSYTDENSDVLEIGCGIGTLTVALLSKARTVLCYEIDQRLCDVLSKFINDENFILVNGDALKIPFNRRIVVSNIPYHITSDILLKISRENVVEKAVLTLQKEIVDRITARPGSRSYGKLTVLLNNLFAIKEGGVYPPSSFYPKPEVYHQVVVLLRKKPYSQEIEKLEVVTKTFFSQRRRLVEKVLWDKFNKNVDSMGELGRKISGKRVFMLDPETWLELTRILHEQGVI